MSRNYDQGFCHEKAHQILADMNWDQFRNTCRDANIPGTDVTKLERLIRAVYQVHRDVTGYGKTCRLFVKMLTGYTGENQNPEWIELPGPLYMVENGVLVVSRLLLSTA